MTELHNIITDNIDIWTSAIKTKSAAGRGSSKKLELVGIKKLRELILELAVQGKLVSQDPNDESASELLKKIAVEKARLLKGGKIKKQKPLAPIATEERPFELPLGWQWQKIGELATQITDGVHHTPKYIDSGVPFISVKDINGKTVSFDDCKYISEKQHAEINMRCNPQFGDVLICRIGTLGRVTIVDTARPFSLFVSVGLIKFVQQYYTPSFTHIVLNSPLLLRQYDEIKAGGSHTNKLNLGDIPRLIMPVAPLLEQHRIVAKVDELMALCDQLETQTEASIAAHKTLVAVLLATLTGAQDVDELNENWQRLSQHFDVLFTTEASIDQLKQTILQLAVMGKLIKQDPNDEPASELLKRIAVEKKQLVAAKKLKQQKALPAISEKEKLFNLPSGWAWSRIAQFGVVGTGGTPSRDNIEYYEPATISWVTSGETRNEFIYETKEKVSPKAVKETNITIYPVGTLIVAMYGQGKTRGQITELMIEAGTNQACAAIRLIEKANEHRKYTKLYFQKAYEELRSHAAGGAQPNLNVGKISLTVIPLPPLSEQSRIVNKVNELLRICGQLKSQIINRQTTTVNLAEALVKQDLSH
jgi:type I restriction enzyme S subunit